MIYQLLNQRYLNFLGLLKKILIFMTKTDLIIPIITAKNLSKFYKLTVMTYYLQLLKFQKLYHSIMKTKNLKILIF